MPKAPEPSSTCQKTTKSLPRISPKSYCYNAVPNRFLAHFSTSRTNGPRSLSRVKAGTLAFANRIAHSGLHGETGASPTGALSLPSERSARSRTSPGRVSERQTLPLLRLDPVCSRKRRGPAGLRRPTPPAERTVLAPISPRVQLCLRRPAFPLSAFIPGA